jgi:hypothetical protein
MRKVVVDEPGDATVRVPPVRVLEAIQPPLAAFELFRMLVNGPPFTDE